MIYTHTHTYFTLFFFSAGFMLARWTPHAFGWKAGCEADCRNPFLGITFAKAIPKPIRSRVENSVRARPRSERGEGLEAEVSFSVVLVEK